MTAAGAGQATEQQLAQAHKALRETRGIQFDFKAAEVPEPPPWAEALIAFLQSVAPMMKYVFWAGVIAGAALILWFFAREFLADRMPRRRTAVVATDWRPEEGKARALLEDADRLAQEGRYEEAIHLLLFRSIDDLASRRPGLVKPALTSRDIAGLQSMPPPARSAFARIAEAVERSFFGGRPAGAEDFQRARQDYQAFAFAESWR